MTAIAALALLAGCGGGSSTPASSTATAAKVATATATATTTAGANPPASARRTAAAVAPTKVAPAKTHKEEVAPHNERIVLTSPVIPSEGAIPSRYTCDGKDISPPLRWREIPPGTSELMLDVLKTKPVNGQLYFAWAVTGLKPTLPGLNAGKLPAGAIVGTNSAGHRGYHLCQPKGTDEGYVIALFALPHHIAAKPGFNAAALRLTAEHTAKYQALYIVNYERR